MVALEPSEPLLLYITATAEAVSMMLVTERPDPHNPDELGRSSTSGSGSQDPGPVEEPGPDDQAPQWPRTSEVPLGLEDQELPKPEPMEIHAPDPLGGSRPSNDRCTTSVTSSMRPRCGTWRSISCFMQYSPPLESCATTFRLTRSWWCPHTH
jgi:hypothetical protein